MKIFGTDKAFGGDEKGQGGVAVSGNHDGENQTLEVADLAAAVDFVGGASVNLLRLFACGTAFIGCVWQKQLLMIVMWRFRPGDEVVPMCIVTDGKPVQPGAKATVLLDRILESDRFLVGTCQRG